MYSRLLPRLLSIFMTLFLVTGLAKAAVTVALSPSSPVSVPVSGTRQFTATVAGATNTAVKWSLTAPSGVSPSAIGTVSSTGKYTAPSTPLPNFASLTITATSVSDNTASASNSIEVRNQIPWVTSLSPSTVPSGAFALTVNGSRFVNGATVLMNGSPLATQFVSSTQLKANGTASALGTASITVSNPGPGAVSTALTLNVVTNLSVAVTPASVSLAPNASQQFQATVTGGSNQTVTWSVAGSQTGTITNTGLYTAPPTPPLGGLVTIYALASDGVTKASATVSVQDPLAIKNGRFLEQATYGPTPALMAQVSQIGIPAFIDAQFALPESTWPPLSTSTRADAVNALFSNAYAGQDQLRQRIIGALSEIIVVSINKNTNGYEIVPWLQLLSRNAFGNYQTLLKELTLDASMGKYLDLVNSGLAGGAPNENYPREVMQLFSIGLYLLNQDGSYQLGSDGLPLATYSQSDVRELARTLTGWTYTSSTGTSRPGGNYSFYPGPMIPVPYGHDVGPKTVLGQAIPANQSIQQDLDSAIGIIFNHPNVGPFIATRLIRALVTSNPSPAYISRVAGVFNGGSGNVRGDMQATIKAILLDPEARNDNPPRNFGRLRSPWEHTLTFTRAANFDIRPFSQIAYLFYGMNQGILDAPSVFGHYSPFYHIPNSPLFGPEFQIFSASDAVNRANLFYAFLYSSWPINPVLQPLVNIASDPNALVNAIDNALLFGRMSTATRTAILNAIPAQYDNNQRVLAALYLALMSGEYLVQH